jgi:peptidyl-prolyl cis-trans isomerase C
MIRIRSRLALSLAIALLLASCDDGGSALVATAGSHELTVAQTVELTAPVSSVAADPRSVLDVAELWIDYTLLAEALAEDPTLEQLDLTPVVQQRMDQEKVLEFRTSVVQLDTALSDSELRRRYAADATDSEVRVRHILLAWPQDATAAQADSVRSLARDLRARAVSGGEDFAALAREYSQDTQYAAAGGDTGYFARGEMITPVEDVAFALEPGEVSEPFESSLGVHLIRVVDRRTPSLSDFRARLQEERTTDAEARYVVALQELSGAELADNAIAVVRRIARFPRAAMADVADDDEVIRYQGGAITVEEVRQFMLGRPSPFRITAAQASDEELRGLILRTMLQSEILVVEAEAQGVTISEAREAEIRQEVRAQLLELARAAGLSEVPSPDRVQEVVMPLLSETLRGTREVVPLGVYAYALAQREPAEVVPEGVEAVVEQLRSLRAIG